MILLQAQEEVVAGRIQEEQLVAVRQLLVLQLAGGGGAGYWSAGTSYGEGGTGGTPGYAGSNGWVYIEYGGDIK